jgi:hypothetical protein
MNVTPEREADPADGRGTRARSETPTGWQRWAAIGGVVFVALLVLGVVLAGDQPGANSSTTDINAFYADSGSRGAALAQAYLAGLAAVAQLGFLASLRSTLRQAEGEPGTLSTLAFGSGLAMLVLLMAAIALRAAVPPAFGFGDEFKNGELDPQLVRLFDAPFYWLVVYASLAGAEMIAATAAVARRTAVPAKRLGRYGYVAAVLALTSLVFPGGFAIPLLWIVTVSIVLARRSDPGGSRTKPLSAALLLVLATAVVAGCGG